MYGYVESQHNNIAVKNKYGVGMKMGFVCMGLIVMLTLTNPQVVFGSLFAGDTYIEDNNCI